MWVEWAMLRFSVVLLVCLVLVGAMSAASRADLAYQPATTDAGVHYIVVSGEFALGDDLTRFAEVVRSHNAAVVGFDSNGGNVVKAMGLGRLIRSYRLHTIQVRGPDCASACALAFMGGVRRIADPGAIGVHKSSFSGDVVLDAKVAVSAVQQLTAEVITYMLEMGVDPALLQLSLKYESDDVRYLSKSEMEQFRVTLGPGSNGGPAPASLPEFPTPVARPDPLPNDAAAEPPPSPAESSLVVPEAHAGRVRHPKGAAPVKARPDGKSASILHVRNGVSLEILGNHDRWYRVRVGAETGYMHHTWVYVEQYESGPFGHRHIQVKSFDNLADAETYVRAASVPLSAYLATNGWFAVTLEDTFDETVAARLVKELKARRSIPDDSFMTYGNTYVRKVCCR